MAQAVKEVKKPVLAKKTVAAKPQVSEVKPVEAIDKQVDLPSDEEKKMPKWFWWLVIVAVVVLVGIGLWHWLY